jgi:ribosome-binding protein aMBF1 (putative translation factor)
MTPAGDSDQAAGDRRRRRREPHPIEPVYREIGQRVRAARMARGLTLPALAAKIGHTRLSLLGIQQARQRVRVHTLYAIARALDVPIASLLPEHG